MKILHLCLANFYIDNYSYQENMLPKFHKKMGLDVEIIASLVSFDNNGKGCLLKNGGRYINEYGIPITRLEYKNSRFSKRLRQYEGTYEAISKSNPDIIFIHGCQFVDIKYIVKYVKNHQNVKVYVDNHADFLNSAKNFLSKNILHKIIWRYCAQLIEPHTTKFYGVLPARVDFLINVYKLPEEKVELLVMGTDDDIVEQISQKREGIGIRQRYNIEKDEFLIVTGGKIDHKKPQTFLLMEAINNINNPKVKLLIFGSVIPEYKNKFNDLLSNNVKYAGWIQSEDAYEYFTEADLVVFPGLHSVFWEQVVGLGKPCVFRYMEGFTHVDLGGNCKFIYEDSVEEIMSVINQILNDNKLYENMKTVARNKGMHAFSYKTIANKSIS